MVDFAHQAEMTDALTVPRAALSRTVVGMAHFAGTGPDGAVCANCAHWMLIGKRKSQVCDKYRLMTGDAAKAVPASTPACRHFAQARQ